MHEARWNRKQNDADNGQTISNASNDRTSRQCARAASMLWRQSRLERFPSSILHFRGGSKVTSRAFRGSGADSSGTCRAFCGSGARSSSYFEPAAARSSGHFASQLWLRARLERRFRANCRSRPGSSDHFEPAAAPGQARAAILSQLRLRARLVRPFRAIAAPGQARGGISRK